MSTETQKRASRRYDTLNIKQIALRLNKKTDKDILDHLTTLNNKQGYLKRLIREDMKKGTQ